MSTNRAYSTGHWAAEVDALGTLLRTELSACETYRTAIHAIERGEGNPAFSLRCLYRSHRRFADELQGMLRELGGHPSETVGAWGVWSGVHERIAATAGRDGGATTLRLLRHGENFSYETAQSALHDLEGPPAIWAKERFAPGIEANIRLVEALERSFEEARPEPPAA